MAKRKAEDINLVYPFSAKRITIIPPFYSINGFTDEGGELMLKTAQPLDFTKDGKLQIKMGVGLTLGADGSLQAPGDSNVTVAPPLQNIKGNVSVKLGEGTIMKDDALSVDVQSPLQIYNSKVGLKTDDSLEVKENKLCVSLDSPLQLTENGISIKTGKGLTISDNSLQADPYVGVRPLYTSGNQIYLNYGQGLFLQDEKIEVKTADPISLDPTKGITLKIGNGLQINNQGAIEASASNLNIKEPLIVENGKVTLDTAYPLYIKDGKLSFKPGRGVKIVGDSLELKIGFGLGFDYSGLVLKMAAPLYADAYGLHVRTGPGVEINSNYIQAACESPITLNAKGKIALSYGSGLDINATNQLIIKKSSGLAFENNALTLDLGLGMEFEGNTIQPKLGFGLLFDKENKLSTKDCGFWTGPIPKPNVWGNQGIFNISLTRLGPSVFGNLQITGIESKKMITGEDEVLSIALYFDQNGELCENSDLKTADWGCKEGNQVTSNKSNPTHNKLFMMPNSKAYPPTSKPALTNRIFLPTSVYDEKDEFKTIMCKIGLNQVPANANKEKYGLFITWGPFFKTPVEFRTGVVTFSYLAEEIESE
ncbi:fiber [Bat mastadenovirus WIV17]|uniref:Fiber n=1 Tax=Bat mastadenovirus WIV17 TaxID=1986505 RepID=A0A1X9RIT2_9ADEN|nr:fiber [Bat mastadenovirus WIV17]ARQ79765.1 fiber [Bat mastadenovirus WIV17]